jgi:hypothetical protein
MMLKGNIPKNGAREELPRIEILTSRFPHSDLDLAFLRPKIPNKMYKPCRPVHCAYAYHYILLFGEDLKPIKTPMSEGYHLEVDDSTLCTEDDSAKYRSIIGCCI